MKSSTGSDVPRQLVHISMASFAFLLRWIPWWAAAFLAMGALLFNLTLLPKLGGGRLMRAGEKEAMARSGVALYAVAVLALVVLFRNHLEVAACAWGVLALGDGFSTLVGRTVAGPRLPWNPDKSWAGSLAFLIFGACGGGGLMVWVAQRYEPFPLSIAGILGMAFCAALLGAVVESLPLQVNDNLSVPLLAGALVYSLELVEPALWTEGWGRLATAFYLALGVTLLFAAGAKWVGAVSWSGFWGGLGIGVTIGTFAGMRGFTVLALFFILGSAATKMGYRSKARRGIAQEGGGARGAVHAIANAGVAAFLTFLAAFTTPPLNGWCRIAYVTALATALCDTLGSEVGPFSKAEPILLARLRRVPAGTPGGVSLLGTAAGGGGALLLGLAALGLDVIPAVGVGIVVLAALFGTLLESLVGGTLEPMGLIGSETSNFVNTLAGGLAALGVLRLIGG